MSVGVSRYRKTVLRYFYAPGSNDWGHIVFVLSVCLFVCLFVCLLSTLKFAITFDPLEVETSYLTCIRTPLMMQSSKDITSPMSETCKIRTGQVKFQDYKPDWACKIVVSKLKKYWTKQTRIPFFKSINRGRYADLFNQRQKWVPL